MPTFKDNKQREWEIKIDALKIMRIREEVDPKFLLHDDDKENTYGRLMADPVLLCRVIYLLCAKERQERGVTEEGFYMEVIGDAVESATEAILKAILSFTTGRKRELIELSAQKMQKIEELAAIRAKAKLSDTTLEDRAVEAWEKGLDTRLEKALTQLSNA